MKFEFGFSGPGRRNLIIGLVVLIVIASIITVVVRSRSKYQFAPTAADDTDGPSLTTAIAACTTLYRQALQQGLSDSSPVSKSQCVQNAVTDYFGKKCPFVVDGTAPPATNTVATAAYNQYTGSGGVMGGGDAAAVTASTQYINLGFGTLPAPLTAAIVTKARKADLTGPTRKYIETACPGFYKPADQTGSDFTTIYKAWKVASATSQTPPTTAGEFGFHAPSVTPASVQTWANKAATPITVALEVTADPAGTTSTTKTISVTGTFPEVLTNAKVKVAGITGVVTGTAAAGSSSIVLTYPSQFVSKISAGTVINKSTASGILSVTFATGGAVPIPNTKDTPTIDILTVTLNLSSPLDSSLTTGSQVLISGSTISGVITLGTIDAARTTVVINFSGQKFPILPTGSTIENVIETPYASPLIAGSTLYNKVGTMSGQKMFNWQIAQVIGPGTYWNSSTAGTSAVQWGS